MTHWLTENAEMIRLGVFLGLLGLFALLENRWPFRTNQFPRHFRWLTNIAIVVAGSMTLKLLLPVMAAGAAFFATAQNIGLLNMLDLPLWFTIPVSLILLDFAIYLQHVVFHQVPLLWRLHKIHHTDLDLDVTTALRFHPLEILLSMLIKMAVVLLLGIPVAAVILFEIILNGMALFNHSNLRLPDRTDQVLRRLLVTPAMHSVHHSCHMDETNSNYGFNLSCWDRFLGTYRERPAAGYLNMVVGLENYRKIGDLGFLSLLRLPFTKEDRP
ncbi:sterol desaturase family protein [Emcibacter sp.]|uniref:sterol desaturase family protein n=1 Tax=Emcibacter sp. TaxID=1979954 RepID=UPI002AA85A13|nr:sterol desaturase family protein [Emcibacter sp.]